MKNSLALGRFCLSLVFLVAGLSKLFHYSATLQLMESHGIPGAALLLPFATTIEILGALSLSLGYRTKASTVVLGLYLIPVTLAFHRFWSFSGEARQVQSIEFLKNISIFGGLTLTYAYQRVLDSFTSGTVSTLRREGFERKRAA
jgi:uncharacterized membrane protein YphA (DoxX/SURF4 family)